MQSLFKIDFHFNSNDPAVTSSKAVVAFSLNLHWKIHKLYTFYFISFFWRKRESPCYAGQRLVEKMKLHMIRHYSYVLYYWFWSGSAKWASKPQWHQILSICLGVYLIRGSVCVGNSKCKENFYIQTPIILHLYSRPVCNSLTWRLCLLSGHCNIIIYFNECTWECCLVLRG